MIESIFDKVEVFNQRNSSGVFDFSRLIDFLCGDNIDNANKVRQQRRFSYFSAFLASRGVKSAVIEEKYVDRDYIQDFANYYSLCFTEYPRFCKRCHFFTKTYSKADIERIVVNCDADEVEALRKNYLGFFVFRPLPVVVFGRTCFRPEEKIKPHQSYLAVVKTIVNFFGVELEVEATPFQEQDSTVSACATSALWTSFQITRQLFGHLPYAPSAITRLATEHSGPSTGNILPNHGLLREEMIHAIGRVGLGFWCETLQMTVGMDYARLKIISAAYMAIGLPVILIVELNRICRGSSSSMGRHAIVACGYRFRKTCPMPEEYCGMPNKYNNIEALYCVDDQVGPYCQMIEMGHNTRAPFQWKTEWLESGREKICCHVTDVLVPLYHKIRVSHDEIFACAIEFFRSIRCFLCDVGEKRNIFHNTILNIRLTDSYALKQYVKGIEQFSYEVKSKVLLASLPRYMWLVSADVGEIPILLFAIDATDVANVVHVEFSVKYDDFLDPAVNFLASESKLFYENSLTLAYLNDCLCCCENNKTTMPK